MANAEAGSAYLSIIPSFKGFSEGVFGGIKTAIGAAGAAFGGLSTAIVATGKAAIDAGAQYEQLAGGTKKIFDGFDSGVLDAARAAQSLGISANSYLGQLNSFGAALKQSLGGDVKKAAEVGDMAIRDMADNASVFGTNIQDVQNAYQGFAKQNYTMLDNLKLGYGGTKEEMQRLIDHANELREANGQAGDLTIDKFSDVVVAIHTVQDSMGIAGNASEEMKDTVSGSIEGMKAAWDNWLVALSNPADLKSATSALITSFGYVAKNILPMIVTIGESMAETLPEVLSTVGTTLLPVLSEALSSAWNAAAAVLAGMGLRLPAIDASQLEAAFNAIVSAIQNVAATLQPIIETVFSTLSTVFEILANNLNIVIPLISSFAGAFVAIKAISVVGPIIKSVADGFTMLKNALGMVKSIQGLATVLTTVAGGPIPIIIAAIAALVAGFVILFNTNEDFRNAVLSVWNQIQAYAMQVWPYIQQAISTAMQVIQNIITVTWPVIQTIISSVMDGISVLMQTVWPFVVAAFQGACDMISQIIAVAWPVIQTVITTVMDTILGIINVVWPTIVNIINMAVTVISTLIQVIWPLISGIITGVMYVIQGVITAVWPIIMAIFQTAGAIISGIVTTVFPLIQGVISGVMAAINTIIAVVMAVISGNWQGAWNAISSFLGGVWNGIKSAVSNGIHGVVSFFGSMPQNILSALGNVGNLLVNAGKSIIDGLLRGITSAFDGVKNFVGGIAGWIADHKGPIPYDLKLLIPNGKAIMKGLKDGLGLGFDLVMDDVVDIAPQIQSKVDEAVNISPLISNPKLLDTSSVLDGDASFDSSEVVTAWLDRNLPRIISTYTPKVTDREWKRAVISA